MRKSLRTLTTKRLDGRTSLAVAVRMWKADVTLDLGGDPTRAQETLLEAAAQKWVMASSLADYIARQPSLVTKKCAVVPVVMHYLQVVDSLGRTLDRLGLDRKEREPRHRARSLPDSSAGCAIIARDADELFTRRATTGSSGTPRPD